MGILFSLCEETREQVYAYIFILSDMPKEHWEESFNRPVSALMNSFLLICIALSSF